MSEKISFRVSDETYSQLKNEADRLGITLSELTRKKIENDISPASNTQNELVPILAGILDKLTIVEESQEKHGEIIKTILRSSSRAQMLLVNMCPSVLNQGTTIEKTKKEIFESGTQLADELIAKLGV